MTDTHSLFSRAIMNENVVDSIVRQITDKIISGDLKPGDKLPIETDLCEAFHVGRNSVREAIKILCAYGIVYIKRSEGTFINDKYSRNMLDPLLYGILLQKDFAKDIILLRKVVDTGIIHHVMNTVTQQQLHILQKHLHRIKELLVPPIDRDALLTADIDFHTQITDFAHNEMLSGIYTYVDRITRPSRKKAIQIILEENKVKEFFELHQKIFTAIMQKQFTQIEDILTNHYQFWERTI